MALWEFNNLNKYNHLRKRIVYSEGSLKTNKKLGPIQIVKRFTYEYNHPLIPPMLWVHNGKKYIMPIWKEVHPNTVLSDIIWKKPTPKPKVKITSHKFKSSSSNITYTTKKYAYPDGTVKFTCSCSGVTRSKDGSCKHIKSLLKK